MEVKIRDDFVGMNRQFGDRFHAVDLQKYVGQQIADPGISRPGKRADKIQLPSLPQEPPNFDGVVRLNDQAEKRAGPLAQQPGKMLEIARPEKGAQGGAEPSLEKPGISNTPAAGRGGIRLSCHIIPRLLIKFAAPIIRDGIAYFTVSETLTQTGRDVNRFICKMRLFANCHKSSGPGAAEGLMKRGGNSPDISAN